MLQLSTFKKVLITFFIVISYLSVYATNYTSKTNGNWSSSNTWNPAGVPGAGDNVTIDDVVTLTDNRSCNTITINTHYCPAPWNDPFCWYTSHIYPELKLGSNTLTIVGSLNNNGVFTANTGSTVFTGTGTINGSGTTSFYNLTINSSGTVTLARNIAVTNLLTLSTGVFNTHTYTLNGAGGLTATGGELQFAKLNTTLPELSGTYTVSGGLLNFTGAGSQTIRAQTYWDVTVSGSGTKTAGGVIDINGNLIISNGVTFAASNNNISIAGNWTNNGGTFTPGTNTVIFNGTAAQTINGSVASQTFYNVVVNLTAGQTLNTGGSTTNITTQNLTQTTGNFTAPATLTINGNLILTAGTFTAGTNIYSKGNWTNNGGTFNSNTNTLTFNGTTAQTINGSVASQTFYNVVVNLTAGQTLNTGGSTTSITTQNLTETTGNFTAPSTLTINGNLILTAGTFTAGTNIYAKGNWTNNGGIFLPGVLGNTVTFNGGTAQFINGSVRSQLFVYLTVEGVNLTTGGSTDTLTITKLTVNAGNFTGPAKLYMEGKTIINAGTYTAGTSIYTLGFWTNNGGAFIPGTSTVTFIGASPKAIDGTSVSQTFYNVILNGAGLAVGGGGSNTARLTVNNLTQTTGDFTAPTDTLNINGNYTRTSGNCIAGANINIKGNWTDNGGTFTPGASTVKFTGTGAQTINGSATSQTFYNVIVSKTPGQTLNTGGNITAITTQNLTQTTGNFTAPPALTINGNLTLTAGTFTAGTNIYAKGNWTNNGGTFNTNTNTVTFNGTAAQTINGSVANSFYNLTFNNTFATSPQYTIGSDITAQNTFSMITGNINLSGNTITIGVSAANPGTLAYSAGWAYGGNFKRYFATNNYTIGNAKGHFPVGGDADYRPFWLAYSSDLSTGGSITVSHSYFAAGNDNVYFPDPTWGPGAMVIYRSKSKWNVTLNNIAATGTIFSIRMKGTGLGPVSSVSDLNLSLEDRAIGTYVSSGGTPTNPEVNRTDLSLSDLGLIAGNQQRGAMHTFYFGSKSSSSPLPISLLKFQGQLYPNKTVSFLWATASETNNDYFTIEKSADALNFEKVIDVRGAGNSTTTLKYTAIDKNPLEGISYYRLKQTDFDGKHSYSQIISINNADKINTKTFVYPNPLKVTDVLKINPPKNVQGKEITISLYDVSGKNIYSKKITPKELENSFALASLPDIKPAVYFIYLQADEFVLKQRLIVY